MPPYLLQLRNHNPKKPWLTCFRAFLIEHRTAKEISSRTESFTSYHFQHSSCFRSESSKFIFGLSFSNNRSEKLACRTCTKISWMYYAGTTTNRYSLCLSTKICLISSVMPLSDVGQNAAEKVSNNPNLNLRVSKPWGVRTFQAWWRQKHLNGVLEKAIHATKDENSPR